jgi:hypothetical protein
VTLEEWMDWCDNASEEDRRWTTWKVTLGHPSGNITVHGWDIHDFGEYAARVVAMDGPQVHYVILDIEEADWEEVEWLKIQTENMAPLCCPKCAECRIDRLCWDEQGERITCARCGLTFNPDMCSQDDE